MPSHPNEIDFAARVRLAETEVRDILAALPPPLRVRAEKLPVSYPPCPTTELIRDGIEPDTLGLFIGPEFSGEFAIVAPVAAQVFLFINNLWHFADADPDIFQEEVRTTFLHELGHYLGLDEDDLFDRGLG